MDRGRWRARFAFALGIEMTLGLGGAAAQVVDDQTATAPEVAYAPSPAYPFGQANPDAPPELASGGRTSGPGLRFHNITNAGFDWNSGGDDPGWTSTCTRRR